MTWFAEFYHYDFVKWADSSPVSAKLGAYWVGQVRFLCQKSICNSPMMYA